MRKYKENQNTVFTQKRNEKQEELSADRKEREKTGNDIQMEKEKKRNELEDRKTRLESILSKEDILQEEPMSKHTTFRIGGPVDFLVTPRSMEEVSNVVTFCKEDNIPYYVIGNGSNLLVGDNGYRGIIIQIGKQWNQIDINDTIVIAKAGVMLSRLAMEAANHGLSGLECEAGIPGTLGGAVTMNAGAYGGEIKDTILWANVISQEGIIKKLLKEELELGYRTSRIQRKNDIVLEAAFALKKGDKQEILSRIAAYNGQRKEKQPLEYPSAGSTFKRPEGQFAGKLIMEAGLKGYRVGDIMVSEKHCGFVINVGNGTAKQVRTLIEDVQKKVYETSGVHLEPEVKFLGEF